MPTSHTPLAFAVPLLSGLLGLAAYPGGVVAQTATPMTQKIAGIFDVEGHNLRINCIGTGSPTVVFEAGQGLQGAFMGTLQRELAKLVLACTYDRSIPIKPTLPTAADAVADLHALLVVAAVPGPYVLVGHSLGGFFVQLYARTYPDGVAGVVAINPVPPARPWLERALPLMTEAEREGERAYYRGEEGDDPFDFYRSFAQLDAAPPPPDIPFEMLISTSVQCESPDDICGRTYPVYQAVMKAVADEWPQGHFSELVAGHETWDGAFEETISVIQRVIDLARSPE